MAGGTAPWTWIVAIPREAPPAYKFWFDGLAVNEGEETELELHLLRHHLGHQIRPLDRCDDTLGRDKELLIDTHRVHPQ